MRRIALIAVLATLPWVGSAKVRRVEGVEVKQESQGAWLAIRTDRPANFTSFKLSQPARVVVDFPETVTTPLRQSVDDEQVRRWRIETLGSEDNPVTRLTVELREDADYTLASEGSLVALRFVPATGRPLVSLEERPAPPAVDTGRREREARELAERLERERQERELAERERRESEARELAERLERERKEREARELAERLEHEREERELAERLERERKEREARELAERLERERKEREARELAERKERERKERELAERLERERKEREARELAERRAHEEKIVTPPAASLDQLSFRRTATGARVTLRTSESVPWAFVEQSDDRLVLELTRTLIPATPNRLPLDTRFFGTSVLRVVPQERRAENATRIVVELGVPSTWSASTEQGALVLDVEPVDGLRAAFAGGDAW